MLNIALDGPSGSGKSTAARTLASRLDILYLDTGAMYRACALEALSRNVDCLDEKAVLGFIDGIDLKIEHENGVQKTILNGMDVSKDIRRNEISMKASDISSLACVRTKMVEMQRKVASEQPCILDGRDIGTVVLPNAEYKFFITASPEARAERRYKELLSRGQTVEYADILKEIKQRDYNDSHRANSPLKQADDAVLLDTTDMNEDEVVEYILRAVENGVSNS